MLIHRTTALLTLLSVATRPVSAQCPVHTDDESGVGAIDHGRAIVTAGYDRGHPSVQFYDKTGQGWQRGQTFDVGDTQIFFLLSVAIDGDRAIAGNSESASQTGQVSVFDRVGDQWIRSELTSATVGPTDFFGSVVAIDGNVAVVGASHWGGPGGGDELGRMHVFEFEGGSWSEVAQIVPYTTEVDVDGDTIVLGDTSSSIGRVHVYRKMAGLWVWTNVIRASSLPENPRLGSSVALQGDTLAVGAADAFPPAAGYVKVYRRQGDGWQQIQHIVPSDSTVGDEFGRSVALSGTTLLVGAPHAASPGPGAVHRYRYDGTSYVEAGHFGPDAPESGFGVHVALQREDAILSTHYSFSFYRLGFADQSSFCPTTPNSTGSPGSLSVEGCDSLDGQRFQLVASGLPTGVIGVFFFGASTTQVPFGDGFRCVGDPFFRLPAGTTDATGNLVHDVDFSSSPASGITSGQTWHFQACHRDPGSLGGDLNLTNALSIIITP